MRRRDSQEDGGQQRHVLPEQPACKEIDGRYAQYAPEGYGQQATLQPCQPDQTADQRRMKGKKLGQHSRGIGVIDIPADELKLTGAQWRRLLAQGRVAVFDKQLGPGAGFDKAAGACQVRPHVHVGAGIHPAKDILMGAKENDNGERQQRNQRSFRPSNAVELKQPDSAVSTSPSHERNHGADACQNQ